MPKTHGLSRTPEYLIWIAMKARCANPRNRFYKRYGGRGISICERWRESFAAFLADMGPRPSPKHSVERRRNDGDYEPGNCFWATIEVQANNRSNNRLVTAFGKTQTVMQWSRETGIKRELISARLGRLKWSPERALSEYVAYGRHARHTRHLEHRD